MLRPYAAPFDVAPPVLVEVGNGILPLVSGIQKVDIRR